MNRRYVFPWCDHAEVTVDRAWCGKQSRIDSSANLVRIVDVADEHLDPVLLSISDPRRSKICQNCTDVNEIGIVEVLDNREG